MACVIKAGAVNEVIVPTAHRSPGQRRCAVGVVDGQGREFGGRLGDWMIGLMISRCDLGLQLVAVKATEIGHGNRLRAGDQPMVEIALWL